MGDELKVAISGFLSAAWDFLTATYIPGTSVSFGALLVALVVISLGFVLLSLVTGHSLGGSEDYGSGVGGRKITVSEQRKSDER